MSAIEFALLAPMLLLLIFGLNELSRALMVKRKVTHAASAAGDLVAQSATVKLADLDNMLAAGPAIVVPFPTGPLSMQVSSITNKNKVITIDWTRGSGGMSGLKTVPADLPTALVANPGDSIIMAEAQYAYDSPFSFGPVLGFRPLSGITLYQRSFMRPRNLSVSCSDCKS